MAIATCRYTANSDGTPGSHHQNDPDLAVVFVESGRGCKLSSQFLSLCKSTTSPLNINYSPENKQTNKQTNTQTEDSRDTTRSLHTPGASSLYTCLSGTEKQPLTKPRFPTQLFHGLSNNTVGERGHVMPSPLKPCHRSHVHTDPSIQDHL